MWKGFVVGVYIASAATEPMLSVDEVHAVPGKGLEGDRYFRQVGTYSGKPGPGGLPPAREVTMIEIEIIEALKREAGIELGLGDSRRNIITRGVPLNHLIDREFQVGKVALRGVRLCEPCAHLDRLARKELLRALIHRGGLRAQILTEGVIRVGDAVQE